MARPDAAAHSRPPYKPPPGRQGLELRGGGDSTATAMNNLTTLVFYFFPLSALPHSASNMDEKDAKVNGENDVEDVIGTEEDSQVEDIHQEESVMTQHGKSALVYRLIVNNLESLKRRTGKVEGMPL